MSNLTDLFDKRSIVGTKLKNIMKVSSEQIAKATNISLERLNAIEAGEEASLAELRDIAMCFSTSVSCLKGDNFFEPQISQLDLFDKAEKEKISGFWGHMGVNLYNSKMLWFPITSGVREMLYDVMNNDRIVVPCMNNRLLYLNMQFVKEIVLLDENCDQPQNMEWDYRVSNGEIPLVLYEALEDYIFDDVDDELMSEKLRMCIQDFMKEKELSEDDVYGLISESQIYYADGNIRPIEIDFTQGESLSKEIEMIYLYEDAECVKNILYCTDNGGAEVILNMKNIAMIEMPLLRVENKIREMQKGRPSVEPYFNQ